MKLFNVNSKLGENQAIEIAAGGRFAPVVRRRGRMPHTFDLLNRTRLEEHVSAATAERRRLEASKVQLYAVAALTCSSNRVLILTLAFATAAHAQSTLVCEGVLGNSGEQGRTLVRFAPQQASGLGVVYDRFGSLWDRAGLGRINRYSPDGRLMASYTTPLANPNRDWEIMTATRDRVVVVLENQLYTLPLDAPDGTAFTPLKVAAQRMAFGTKGNQVACWNGDDLLLVDVITGKTAKAGTLPGDKRWLEMGPDGAIYPVTNNELNKFVNGVKATTGWPKSLPGERPQLLDGSWWGNSWHGTIRRFNANLEPDPGVVLGGASGSFIGHLDQNSDISNGRGLAKVSDGVYAVSGIGGTMHLLEWQNETRQFTIVRRIGSIPFCRGLGLDKNGMVFSYAGSWQWNDRPDTPLRFGTVGPDGEGIGQGVMLYNERLVAPAYLWGQPGIYAGALNTELQSSRTDKSAMPRDAYASAVYKNSKGEMLLLAGTPAGKAAAYKIDDNGRFQGDIGEVTLQTTTPIKELTTFALKDENTLLAAIDGVVVEFIRDSDNWKETRRWQSWGDGAENKFGAQIYITADAGRLWVADRDRNRVLAFDVNTNFPLASFGTLDRKADDLKGFDAPTIVAARGNRAVVYDSGNQRIIKLSLK